MLGECLPKRAKRDFPFRILFKKLATIMCVLVEKVEDGAVARLKHMRAGHLDQLSRFREAEMIGFLLDGATHHCHCAEIHYPYMKSSREGDAARLVGDLAT